MVVTHHFVFKLVESHHKKIWRLEVTKMRRYGEGWRSIIYSVIPVNYTIAAYGQTSVPPISNTMVSITKDSSAIPNLIEPCHVFFND